jgi:hypothetical protein
MSFFFSVGFSRWSLMYDFGFRQTLRLPSSWLIFGRFCNPLNKAGSGREIGGEAEIGRNRGAGCFPVGSHHMVSDKKGEAIPVTGRGGP